MHQHSFVEDWAQGATCVECEKSPEQILAERQPILLIGGPWDLDGTEIPDTVNTIQIVKDSEGQDHLYYVQRDWVLNRWVGKYQNTRKIA